MFSNPEKNLMQASVGRGMHVAEFGCGSGFYTLAVASLVGHEGKVYAIDVQRELLHKVSNEAKKLGLKNVSVIHADIETDKASALREESIDVVVIANTLFLIEKKDHVAEEARRILRKNGRVLVVEWSDTHAGIGPHAKSIIGQAQTESLFKTHGFSKVAEIDAGEHHYGIIFRK